MRNLVVILSSLLLGLAVVVPTNAAHRRSNQTGVDWATRDTAVYVVSTLNLLRTDGGQPMTQIFKSQLHVKRYVVEADMSVPDLYFVELLGKSKSPVGVFAYKMGWQKPQAITDFGYSNLPHAPQDIVTAYKLDHRAKVATFKSTLPS